MDAWFFIFYRGIPWLFRGIFIMASLIIKTDSYQNKIGGPVQLGALNRAIWKELLLKTINWF